MSVLRTEDGNRPDLENLEVNWPHGYLGVSIFPVSGTTEKAGSFTYKQVQADAAPQEDRPWSTSLVQNKLTTGSHDYSVTKQERRSVVPEDEVKELGGIENADKAGAEDAVRQVMRKFEDDTYAKVITTARKAAAVTLGVGSEFDGMNYAADSCRRIKGQLALVCSSQWFMRFISRDAVIERVKAMGGLAALQIERTQALSLGAAEVITPALQAIVPVQRILIGDDDPWAGDAKYAAIVSIPDVTGTEDSAAIMAAKRNPIYGLSKWFRPEPAKAQPFSVSSFFLPDNRVNAYDCVASYTLCELNSAGAKLVKLDEAMPYSA